MRASAVNLDADINLGCESCRMTLKFELAFLSPNDGGADYSLRLPFSPSFFPCESKVADKSIDFSIGNSDRARVLDDRCGAGEFDAFCSFSRETGTTLHIANPWARENANSEEPCKITVEIRFAVRLTVTNDGFTFVIPSVPFDSHFNRMGYDISTITKEVKDVQPSLKVFGMTEQGTIATNQDILKFTDKNHPFSRPMEMRWRLTKMDRVPRPLRSHVTFLFEYDQTRRGKVQEIYYALCDAIQQQIDLLGGNADVTVIRYGDQSDRHEIHNKRELDEFRNAEPRYAIRSLKEALAEAKESVKGEGMIVLLSQVLPSGHGADTELEEELRNLRVVLVDRYLEGGTRENAIRLGIGFTYALDVNNIWNAAMRAGWKSVPTHPSLSRCLRDECRNPTEGRSAPEESNSGKENTYGQRWRDENLFLAQKSKVPKCVRKDKQKPIDTIARQNAHRSSAVGNSADDPCR